MANFVLSLIFILLLTLEYSESACPYNTVPWNSQCFMFFNETTGFADAELRCNQTRGHLASIHDGFANTLLAEEASKYFRDSTETDFWVGANSLMIHENWTWTDGSNLDFSDWKPGEPQNVTGGNCAAMSLTDGYWSAQDCFKLKPFVCEVPATPNYPEFENCSLGWFYFQKSHSCYGINYGDLVGVKQNWTAAQKYCESVGAQLPSIHSYEEDLFLRYPTTIVWSGIWIGYYSTDEGKTWFWSDGSPVDYDGWETNYQHQIPHNDTTAVYAIIGANGYDNSHINDNWYAMCKKPAK